MSANYWESTQRRNWQFTKDQLAAMRQKLEDDNSELVRMFPLGQPRHLNIYFNQRESCNAPYVHPSRSSIPRVARQTDPCHPSPAELIRLSKRLGVRQQAMATAQVYMKRFYLKVEIRRTNPYLVIATCVYLASKMEEAPQHIRLIVTEARQMWQEYLTIDTSKLGECEFFMISEMSSQLIVHQPYRTITALRTELSLMEDDVQLARQVINDHFMTDLPLIYSPHTIALVAILLALVLRPNNAQSGQGPQATGSAAAAGLAAAQAALSQAQTRGLLPGMATPESTATDSKEKAQEGRVTRVQRFAAWLSESNIDIAQMVDVAQEIVSFYDCYELYNDKLTREQLNRFVKARGLDK